MTVELLIRDYIDAEHLNEYFATWDMQLLDRRYTATETLIVVDMADAASKFGWTWRDIQMDLEDEFYVKVDIVDVY